MWQFRQLVTLGSGAKSDELAVFCDMAAYPLVSLNAGLCVTVSVYTPNQLEWLQRCQQSVVDSLASYFDWLVSGLF
jgi:hypothetical protein